MNGLELPATTTDRRADIAGWLLIGAIGVAALFLGFVHAPQRIKLPLLSPLALGAVAGWGLGRWAIVRQVPSVRLVIAASFCLIAAGQIGAAFETYRLGVGALRTELNRRSLEQSPLADQIEQGLIEMAEDEATRDEFRIAHEGAHRRRIEESERHDRLLTIAGYLESRIPKQWGAWPPPWPELFWGIEIMSASLMGAWLAGRCRRSQASGERPLPEENADSRRLDS